jgi:hypothetical protein
MSLFTKSPMKRYKAKKKVSNKPNAENVCTRINEVSNSVEKSKK